RLRARALASVHDSPQIADVRPQQQDALADIDAADFLLAQRLRDLRKVRAPERLRARTLDGVRDWQNARRVVPLADIRRRRETWTRLASRAVAAAALAVSIGYTTYAASASSLPDSPFYSVKLFVEDIRVAVASPDVRPQIYVERADQRLEETRRLIDNKQYP